MTIREVAKLCGVSPATVSRVFNQRQLVSEDICRKVDEVIAQTGYRRNRIPRLDKSTGKIGVLVPDIGQSFYQSVVKHLQKAASAAGKNLLAFCGDPLNPQAILQSIQDTPLDGLILLQEEIGDDVCQKLRDMELPLVMCGALSLGKPFSSVHVDDLRAAFDATNYLISLGHRKIAFLSDHTRSISSGFQRLTGCRKALEDAGLTLGEELVVYCDSSYDSGYQAATELLNRGVDFTALFAFSDDRAAGALAALHDCGLRVPGEVSVMGFDDVPLAKQTLPPLTTVHQPIDLFARQAVNLLGKDRGLRSSSGAASITLMHTVVQRNSCAPRLRFPAGREN